MNKPLEPLHIPGFCLPESPLLPEATRQALHSARTIQREQMAQAQAAAKAETDTANQSSDKTSPEASPEASSATSIKAQRQQQRDSFYQSQPYQDLRALYDVEVRLETLAGVVVETIVPAAGIAEQNQQRVLVNLHSGNFEYGSQTTSQMESIPVAALGRIKVISVDYRLAPEVQFPAATDDVEAVYRALLKDYAPSNMGIFGSSAGAQLAGQLMVRLQTSNTPQPGAIAMIAAAATKETGDSIPLVAALLQASIGYGGLEQSLKNAHYLKDADWDSPAVAPAQSDAVMAAFPPTLLATSTRDFLMSSVVATHSQLTRLNVETDLHVWEGLDHVFHCNHPTLPESAELHRVTVRFFERHLGRG